MDNFGTYITKEYGILKMILKHLSFRDLLVARNVCKDWCDVINRMFLNEFSNTPEVYFTENAILNKDEKEFWVDMISVPEIVIKFHTYGSDFRLSELTDIDLLWSSIFDMGLFTVCDSDSNSEAEYWEKRKMQSSCELNPVILHLRCEGCYSFSSLIRNGPKEIYHSSFYDVMGASSTVSLPKVSGVHYDVITLSLKMYDKNKPFDLKELDNCDKGPVKCVLFYENSFKKYDKIMKRFLIYLFSTVMGQQTAEFAFGGGKVKKISYTKRISNDLPDVCCIIIRGENVSAVSDVMNESLQVDEMDSFFEELANKVGPLPEGASRIALTAQCVDRPNALKRIYRFPEVDAENLENHHFNIHFPKVPICGFLACGEYGLRAQTNNLNDSEDITNAKRIKLSLSSVDSLIHWYSTSIVLITYLKT